MIFKVFLFSLIAVKLVGCNRKTSGHPANYELLPCENDYECEEVQGKCVENVCKCNGTFFCNEPSKPHLTVTKIGETCSRNQDCNIESSHCLNHKCTCKPGFVTSHDKRKCLKVADGLGSECEDSVQCSAKTPSSGCHENKCSCHEHMHEHNGTCYKIADLGDQCEHNEECLKVEKSTCVNSKCQCLDGYVTYKSRCLRVAEGLESPCTETIQCTEKLGSGSQCLDGFCQCHELFQLKNATGKCVHDMLLDESCMDHTDCHQPNRGLSRLECILGVCKCRPTYFQQDGHCISRANHYLGSFLPLLVLVIIYLL